MEVKEHQEKVRTSRKSRLPNEPATDADAVQVQVHHVTFGIVRRRFSPTETVSCIYDWIGSLSLTSKHFKLSDFKGNVFLPYQPIYDENCTSRYMAEATSSPTYEDAEVQILGFCSPGSQYNLNDTIVAELTENSTLLAPPDTLEPGRLIPPTQLLECDDRWVIRSCQYL